MRVFLLGEDCFSMRKFEIFEHTADIGINVYGRTMRDIFINSAKGMFEIIAGKNSRLVKDSFSYKINVQAEDLEDLLVAWLNELLYISEIKLVILNQFKIKELSYHHIEAEVEGIKINRLNHKIDKEVKAVTYHCLEIIKNEETGLWRGRIIFDI